MHWSILEAPLSVDGLGDSHRLLTVRGLCDSHWLLTVRRLRDSHWLLAIRGLRDSHTHWLRLGLHHHRLRDRHLLRLELSDLPDHA